MPAIIAGMEGILFERRVPGTAESIANLVRDAVNAVVQSGWCGDKKCASLEAEVEDLLLNARMFGNENRRDRTIHLQVVQLVDRCEIRIQSECKPADPMTITLIDQVDTPGMKR